jgi:hypothetical protein
MSLLRILRNLAVLVILTVGVLAMTPRPAMAILCPCAGSGATCGVRLSECPLCKGKRGCRFTVCFDILNRRCCTLSSRKQCV